MATTTTSPASAAPAGVEAVAAGPISPTRPARDSGPWELARTTSWPAPARSRARVPPMLPEPMIPIFMGRIVALRQRMHSRLAEDRDLRRLGPRVRGAAPDEVPGS